nr:putative gustatory receptor 28a [Halyomorpha halys]
MRAVDLQMLSLGKKLPQTKPSWVTLLIYTLLTTAFFLKAPVMPNFMSCIKLLILYGPYLFIISVEDHVDRINSLLRLRFNAIKNQLLQCSRMGAKKGVIVLEKLILCHDRLCSSSENIDEFLWVQVLSVLTVMFLASFCEIYATSIMYRDDSLAYKGIFLTEKFLWISVMLIITSRICHQFSAITTEAEKFNVLLYQLMIDDKTNNILNNSKLKLHIEMNRKVVFTARGFLKLDYSLLHSVIASSMTYLVIVFQFGVQSSFDFNEATSEDGNNTSTTVPLFLTTA